MIQSHHPIIELKGVGEYLAMKLKRLGILSIEDLLFHLPKSYQDRTQTMAIGQLNVGMNTSIEGHVTSVDIQGSGKKILSIRIQDPTGSIHLKFFNFSRLQKNNFSLGRSIRAYGEIKYGQNSFDIIHPECQFDVEKLPKNQEKKLTPIYSTAEGFGQLTLRKLIKEAFIWLQKNPLEELIPWNNSYFMPISQALKLLHYPSADISISQLEQREHPAQKRIIFEELLAHSLSLQKYKKKKRKHASYPMPSSQTLKDILLGNLPFQLTEAQRRVVADIEQDLQINAPMMRLVQGDVGSGKTIVAACAALTAIENGYQVALLAPTELLAEQHFKNFTQWFHPLQKKVTFLSGKLTTKTQKEAHLDIKNHQTSLIIGTHAIFQEHVQYENLGLIIIDEQHRFGVQQRIALQEKGISGKRLPHQLIMTATPIPRTLAMTTYAELDCSVIDQRPAGRFPIETVAISNRRRTQIIERIKHAINEDNKQVYWVCTLIEQSETLQCEDAEKTFNLLQQELNPVKIGLVHGRLKAEEKHHIMCQFQRGDIDLLVATTVIEVGVDVPNATLMIIENPERLGLAQLHQLRGRVGRGSKQSHCVLLYKEPLSLTAQERLDILRKSNDGFLIAERDLELRGPGEYLGTKQTGLLTMKIADLSKDHHLLPEVHAIAQQLLLQRKSKIEAIIQRWIGKKQRYHLA